MSLFRLRDKPYLLFATTRTHCTRAKNSRLGEEIAVLNGLMAWMKNNKGK